MKLGMKRTTLQARMQKLGIAPPFLTFMKHPAS